MRGLVVRNCEQCHYISALENPEWKATRIIPGGFDNARGYYPELGIDTSYIHQLNNPRQKQSGPVCDVDSAFRTLSGECNNLNNPGWGAAGAYFQRFIHNAYQDRKGVPRGGRSPSNLPSPRIISRKFHNQLNVQAQTVTNLFFQVIP